MWVAEYDKDRLWNATTETELVKVNESSSGTITFALRGPDGYQEIPAQRAYPELTREERLRLGVPDGNVLAVWQVLNWPDDRRQEIKEALLAYKYVLGQPYPGSVYLVQFGLRGELEHA